MPLISFEINLIISWSKNCFMAAVLATGQISSFARTNAKIYVPVATLSTQYSSKLL